MCGAPREVTTRVTSFHLDTSDFYHRPGNFRRKKKLQKIFSLPLKDWRKVFEPFFECPFSVIEIVQDCSGIEIVQGRVAVFGQCHRTQVSANWLSQARRYPEGGPRVWTPPPSEIRQTLTHQERRRKTVIKGNPC